MERHLVLVDAYEDAVSIRNLSGQRLRLTMEVWDSLILVGKIEIYNLELVRVDWPVGDDDAGMAYEYKINIYGEEPVGSLVIRHDMIEIHPARDNLVFADFGSGRRVEVLKP